jgi:hypothetical protein
MGADSGPAGEGAHRTMRPASEEGQPGVACNRRAHGGSIAAGMAPGCTDPAAERQAEARRARGGRAHAAACRLLAVLVLIAQLRGCSTWFYRYAN